jgi:redox-sensitive bicupin YhaK (pirin superfamily)
VSCPVAALGACRSEAPERAPSLPPPRTREAASIVDAFATRDGAGVKLHMLDVTLPARGRMSHPFPAAHNAFAYVIEGAVLVGDGRTRVAAGQLAVVGAGDVAAFRADDGGRLLLLAAHPIGEPVARYGPFVMSTDEELRQAVDDYKSGRLTQGI